VGLRAGAAGGLEAPDRRLAQPLPRRPRAPAHRAAWGSSGRGLAGGVAPRRGAVLPGAAASRSPLSGTAARPRAAPRARTTSGPGAVSRLAARAGRAQPAGPPWTVPALAPRAAGGVTVTATD